MFPGPVFRFELITTARRRRFHVVRVLYGLFLLVTLWIRYAALEWRNRCFLHSHGGYDNYEDSVARMSQFAQAMFMSLAFAQGVALLCLVPALLAGVIADEHQRKTLHYLLASRLSSAEIVLGKLGARLVHAGVIVLIGVPIVCLLSLFGGLDPWEVGLVYAGTAALVLFLAGLSLLASVLSRRPREAILAAYLLVAVWLFLPLVLEGIAPYYDWPLGWVAPVNGLVMLTNPVHGWRVLTGGGNYYIRTYYVYFPGYSSQANFAISAGLQAVLGLLFLTLATVWLRPLRGRERVRSPKKERRYTKLLAGPVGKRPPCPDDDPMLWKEGHASGGGFAWLRSKPVLLVLGVLLACYLYDTALPAFGELFGRRAVGGWSPRLVLNGALRESGTFLFVLLLLSVASAAAVSMTSEREQDTWISLNATLLTGREIVVGKIRGAVQCSKRLVLALLIMGTVGLCAGAIHPLGALAAALGLFVYCGFTAALGTFISLHAKNSTRALFATILWMLVFNVGYLVPIVGLTAARDMVFVGMMPYLQWLALLSYPEAAALFKGRTFQISSPGPGHGLEAAAAYLISIALYGLAALVLAGATIEGYDKAADRPG